ncbi:MAG: hypothetical protein HQK87_01610 [Nitrospinae bacterium]|nr:hypothetical protein [Nitrospinota bacterium]
MRMKARRLLLPLLLLLPPLLAACPMGPDDSCSKDPECHYSGLYCPGQPWFDTGEFRELEQEVYPLELVKGGAGRWPQNIRATTYSVEWGVVKTDVTDDIGNCFVWKTFDPAFVRADPASNLLYGLKAGETRVVGEIDRGTELPPLEVTLAVRIAKPDRSRPILSVIPQTMQGGSVKADEGICREVGRIAVTNGGAGRLRVVGEGTCIRLCVECGCMLQVTGLEGEAPREGVVEYCRPYYGIFPGPEDLLFWVDGWEGAADGAPAADHHIPVLVTINIE